MWAKEGVSHQVTLTLSSGMREQPGLCGKRRAVPQGSQLTVFRNRETRPVRQAWFWAQVPVEECGKLSSR